MLEPTAEDQIAQLNKDMQTRDAILRRLLHRPKGCICNDCLEAFTNADAIRLAQLALAAGCVSEGEGWLDKLDQR